MFRSSLAWTHATTNNYFVENDSEENIVTILESYMNQSNTYSPYASLQTEHYIFDGPASGKREKNVNSTFDYVYHKEINHLNSTDGPNTQENVNPGSVDSSTNQDNINNDDVSSEENMNSSNVVNTCEEGLNYATNVDLPGAEKNIDSTNTNIVDNDQNNNSNKPFLRQATRETRSKSRIASTNHQQICMLCFDLL